MVKKTLMILIAAVLMFSLCSCNNKTTETNSPGPTHVISSDADWPTEYAGSDVLPKIQDGDVNYYKLYDRVLRIYIYNVDENSFLQYIELLKRTGYSDIAVETKEAFSGNLNEYSIVMNRDNDTNRMVLELTTPLSWPKEGYITMLPVPPDVKIIQIIGESNSITVIAEDIGKTNFAAYTADIIAAGFKDILVTSDTVFVAENEEYIATIVRQPEKNTMDIGVYEKN